MTAATRFFRILRPCMLATALLLVASPPVIVHADDDGQAPPPVIARETFLHRAWGAAVPATLNVGMWTRHVDRSGVDQSNLYGGTIRGIFFGTFLNSYHERSYAFGIERRVARGAAGPVRFGAGYRLGVIQGYDARMIPVAGTMPVVPFVQALGDVTWKNKVGLQASFCVKVLTWGAIVRF